MSRRGAISLSRAWNSACSTAYISSKCLQRRAQAAAREKYIHVCIECVGVEAVGSLVLGNFLWLQKAHRSFLCLLKRTNYAG